MGIVRIGKGLALITIGLSLGWVLTQPDWEPLIVLVCSISALIGLLYADTLKEPSFQWFRTRKHYLDKILDEVNAANRQILMCVHTLAPPRPRDNVERLHHLLCKKTSEGVDVRVLAPTGGDRVEASYALMKSNIKVRHLPSLADTDISFSVFDSIRSVIPTTSGHGEETVAGLTIHSAKLADLLKSSFRSMWWSYDALPYEPFVRYMLKSAVHDPASVPLSVFSKKFGIPEEELLRILPAYGRRDSRMHFFIIGKPASGKTTVGALVRRYLERKGVDPMEIYHFNDYAALYERFVEDKERTVFQPYDRDGFRVKDFSVLDTVLKQADIQLRLAHQSNLAFIVEFSRPSYLEAFRSFDRDIMQHCVIISLQCSLDTCEKRNDRRTEVNSAHTTGFVPPDILHDYYAADDVENVKKVFGARVVEIDTNVISLDQLDAEIQARLDAQGICSSKAAGGDA